MKTFAVLVTIAQNVPLFATLAATTVRIVMIFALSAVNVQKFAHQFV